MFTPTTPIAGFAISGLTSPTYTFVSDVAPSLFGKQVAVTALGGTQAGVTAHSISSPFTATATRPSVLKPITYNSNGTVKSIPVNSTKLLVRKGVSCLPTVVKVASISISFDIPAGAETYDAANLNALYSAAIGLLQQQGQGLRDSATAGIL